MTPISLSREGSVTILKPMGPLVLGELEELDTELLNLFNRWTKRLILNMNDVSFVDSAGFELLVRHQRDFGSHGLRLIFCHINDTLQKVMDLTRLSLQFEIYPEKVNAVRSFL